MAKTKEKKAKKAAEAAVGTSTSSSLFGGGSALDATLSSLFASSAGPLQAPVKTYTPKVVKRKHEFESTNNEADAAELLDQGDDGSENGVDNDAVLSEISDELDGDDEAPSEASIESEAENDGVAPVKTKPERARKRKAQEDDLEGLYLQKLAREDGKADYEARESKRQKTASTLTPAADAASDSEADSEADSETSSLGPPPQHETLTKSTPADADADKAARTLFLGNVSTTAITSKSAKRALLAHLAAPLSTLPASTPAHKVESLRFRSTAFAGTLPKKAAFATQDLKEATAHATNAYVVYTTRVAARTALAALNASVILGRHLRADSVAHPAATDHKRCVFVGNVGFVDDESAIKAAETAAGYKGVNPKPLKGDAEEGLWQAFAKAGAVESVRVVRDPQTRVGKGIAYVQFADEIAVEKALAFDGQKFPPLLPRKLRVSRAKKPSSTAGARERRSAAEVPKRNQLAGDGRARKLFGKAGAATKAREGRAQGGIRRPESFVFEGHRATDRQGGGVLKTKKGKKKGGAVAKKSGRPGGRSAKRGAAWKSQSKGKQG